MQPDLSVVIPCHNEELVLDELHKRLSPVLLQTGLSHEIVLVDDGSTDSTWSTMCRLNDAHPNYVCIRLTRNFGHQRALSAGLDLCRGERILILDADLQDPPELLPAMLVRMDEGYDVVYGQRTERQGETSLKRHSAGIFYRLMNQLAERPIPQDAGDFRLLSRRALDMLKSMPEYHRFIRGMVSWIGLRQTAFTYVRKPRFAGTTKYPYRRMLGFAVDAITSFSIKPLTLASWLGVMSALVGMMVFLYALYSWWWLDAVPGWTSTIGALAVFQSIQLLVLGVMGEYLGRLYEQSKGRPLYLIEDVVTRRES